MKRLREWVRARAEAAILPVVRRCMTEVVDSERLALQVSTLRAFSKEASPADELVARSLLYNWPVAGWLVLT